MTWKEVTVRCLCAAWRPLWPECVLQRDFEGFEESEEEAVVHEIVALGNSMGLEVDDDDVEELVEEHSKELSTEELLELHKEENETLKRSLTSEESGEEEDKEESRIIPAKDLKDAFFCWSKLSKLAEDYHPDVGSVQKAISVFNDNVMNYFWKVQKSSVKFPLTTPNPQTQTSPPNPQTQTSPPNPQTQTSPPNPNIVTEPSTPNSRGGRGAGAAGGAGCAGLFGSRMFPHCARQTLSRKISSRPNLERSSKQLTFKVWHCAPEEVQVHSVQGVGVRVSPMPTAWLPMTQVLESRHS
ncbi:Tigger transposable element-derived protein 1-like 142 [Homarus americanus]|uniref:Tigger transposable element-derived protein 1-like 142 n=1 Tax=Homarus americanus TaxID=6706 RepID=A0A8J5MNC4_HOMAM|nr:Tigger transposable element-derived protein 1-like 142 [Homarus americanus]